MKRLLLMLLSIMYMVATVYFYLKPGAPRFVVGSDKFLHFVGFFFGGLLFLLCSKIGVKGFIKIPFILFLVIGPIVLEFLQILSPYRHFDAIDIVFNYFGWMIPVLIFLFIRRLQIFPEDSSSKS
ncbi:antibiotic resistance protein VanZ [Mesotoga sp. BH458_6_3_2_1]|uniref:antibiotic resistance protein VanZ n=1 Tax=Mesotoga sp. BH458_6_3_2_1 TaxID=1437446 RepID=UPI000EF1C9F8|nr:antibiotic resistance protein VanZ [Mesotoga sp. BH458_6_3_2_1]RLL87270.1 antibiotic resistance protein VanZ [Mesotoga sp. BH458_6_3_2_1]